MAECLEGSDSEDTNRKVDELDYLANQFAIFTNEYREKTEPSCLVSDGHDHLQCEEMEKKSKQSKKEIVNITRKLQKALISLEMMKGNEIVSELLEKLRKVNSDLRDAILKNQAEFSVRSVRLPDYDPVDMACLLGGDQVNDQKTTLQLLEETTERDQNEMKALLMEADILIREYEHIKIGISTF